MYNKAFGYDHAISTTGEGVATLMTSCLFHGERKLSNKRSALKGKNLLLEEQVLYELSSLRKEEN